MGMCYIHLQIDRLNGGCTGTHNISILIDDKIDEDDARRFMDL